MISFRTGALIAGGGAAAFGGVALARHLRGEEEEPAVPVSRLADRLLGDFDVRSTRGNRDGAVDIALEGVRSVHDRNEYDTSFEGLYGFVDVHVGSWYRRTHGVLMWSDIDKAGHRDRHVTRAETSAWLADRYDQDRSGILEHPEQQRLRRDYPTAFTSSRELG